jgi:hypothetical protein
MFISNINFNNLIYLNINNIDNIYDIEIKEMILIIFFISSILLKFLKIKPPNDIIDNFGTFIMIIIFLNNFLRFFKLKKINSLKTIFFFN